MLTAFVVHELAVPAPVIDLRLLHTRNFTLGLLLIVAFSFT